MSKSEPNQIYRPLEQMSYWLTERAGTSWAFAIAALAVLVWLVTGPLFDYSDTWQLIINTGTTIVTFLMVFLIQRSQNKEALAVQLKLNEIIAALQGASNRLVGVERMPEEDLKVLDERYKELTVIAKTDPTRTNAHSIEETKSLNPGSKLE
jgi:low affinity Fe/Cu permease